MSKNKKNKSGHSIHHQPQQLAQLQQVYLQAQQLQQKGYLTEAEKLYREILSYMPDQPDCLHYLGLILLQKGDAKQAESFIRRSIKATVNPIYHGNYGLFFSKQNKHKEAVTQYKKAVELKSDYAEAWYNLGISYYNLGDMLSSENAYKQAVNHRPNYIKALYSLANIQESLDKADDANETILKVLKIIPRTVEEFYTLGLALQFLGGSQNIHRAHEYFRKALEISPESIEIYVALAKLLEEGNKIELALETYKQILSIEPDYYDVKISYVNCLILDDQIDAATYELKKIMEKNPDSTQALGGLASIYRINGNFSDAETTYNKILDIDKHNSNAFYGIALGKKFNDKNDEFVKKLIDVSGRKKTAQSYYALGKIYNDLGEYDSAFEAYHRANQIKNRKIEYNISEHSGYVNSIIEVFNKNLVDRMQTYGSNSELPVFIVGTPRSGTTLTEQIISSHPNVIGAGELKFIDQLATNKLKQHATDKKYPDRIEALTPELIKNEAELYLKKLPDYQDMKSVLRFSDKMPANFFHIGYIFILFPKAKIIHCKRHPLDSCLSIYFQAFQASHQYSFDLRNLGHWYLDYLRLMEHWKNIFGDKLLDVEYNDTVNDTENTARRLIEFCGLEWDAKCLEFYKQDREVKTASQWQVRQPIYKTSLERWKHYEKYIEVLKEILAGYY